MNRGPPIFVKQTQKRGYSALEPRRSNDWPCGGLEAGGQVRVGPFIAEFRAACRSNLHPQQGDSSSIKGSGCRLAHRGHLQQDLVQMGVGLYLPSLVPITSTPAQSPVNPDYCHAHIPPLRPASSTHNFGEAVLMPSSPPIYCSTRTSVRAAPVAPLSLLLEGPPSSIPSLTALSGGG